MFGSAGVEIGFADLWRNLLNTLRYLLVETQRYVRLSED